MIRLTHHYWMFMLTVLTVLSFSSTLNIQAQPVVADGAVAFNPEGVWIDAKGQLHLRDEIDPKFTKTLKERSKNKFSEELVFISLPKAFKEAQALIQAGKPLTDELKYLGGMTRLHFILIDSETGELIIAGPREEIDLSNPHRPVGKTTGWPVLQMDDLVTALRRTHGPRAAQGFGCTIELKSDASKAMLEAFEKNKHLVRKGQKSKVAELMAEAGGHQPIRFFNMPGSSRFANVAVEADYRMKRLALGLDKSPVRKVPSYIKLLRGPAPMQNRFWLELNDRVIKQAKDGSVYQLEGNTLRISTAPVGLPQYKTKASPAAQRFASLASEHFEDLARQVPSFADLSNLGDLSILAALIAEDQLASQAKWDMQWLIQAQGGYPVPAYITPTQAPCLVNHYPGGGGVMFAAGGVLMNPKAVIAKREKVERQQIKVQLKQ